MRCAPAHIHQIRAGVTLEGVQPLVHLRYAFPSRSASTGPSGGAGPPRLRRGCSRPRPRFRGQAAASFIRAAATARRRSPFISARFVAPRGAQCRGDAHVVLPRKPLTFEQPAACPARAAARRQPARNFRELQQRGKRLLRTRNPGLGHLHPVQEPLNQHHNLRTTLRLKPGPAQIPDRHLKRDIAGPRCGVVRSRFSYSQR